MRPELPTSMPRPETHIKTSFNNVETTELDNKTDRVKSLNREINQESAESIAEASIELAENSNANSISVSRDSIAGDDGAVNIPQPASGLTSPVIAKDDDLIEKEWVEKAKKIVRETRDDPFKQDIVVNELRWSYIEKRYNRKKGGA